MRQMTTEMTTDEKLVEIVKVALETRNWDALHKLSEIFQKRAEFEEKCEQFLKI